MATEAQGKYARQHRGVGHFAWVVVQLDENASEPGVTVQCSAVPRVSSQGEVEDVPARGYNDLLFVLNKCTLSASCT